MITVTGTLSHDAVAATSLGARVAVIILTIDAGTGPAVEVRHVVGDTPESHINARRLAAGMRRGAPVTATAARFEYCNDHGLARLVLRQPSAIRVRDWELQ